LRENANIRKVTTLAPMETRRPSGGNTTTKRRKVKREYESGRRANQAISGKKREKGNPKKKEMGLLFQKPKRGVTEEGEKGKFE